MSSAGNTQPSGLDHQATAHLDQRSAAHRIPAAGAPSGYATGQLLAFAVVLLLVLPLLPLILLVIGWVRYRDHGSAPAVVTYPAGGLAGVDGRRRREHDRS